MPEVTLGELKERVKIMALGTLVDKLCTHRFNEMFGAAQGSDVVEQQRQDRTAAIYRDELDRRGRLSGSLFGG